MLALQSKVDYFVFYSLYNSNDDMIGMIIS